MSSLIPAFGKTPEVLVVPDEEKLVGKSVSYCAIYDTEDARFHQGLPMLNQTRFDVYGVIIF